MLVLAHQKPTVVELLFCPRLTWHICKIGRGVVAESSTPEVVKLALHKFQLLPKGTELMLHEFRLLPKVTELTLHESRLLPKVMELALHGFRLLPKVTELTLHEFLLLLQSEVH